MNKDTSLRFGVNYVPSKNWFYSWANLNFDDVEADFQAISSVGVDHIRMHLRWDLFQPNETYVCDEMLVSLKKILDLAAKYRLMAEVTVFDGWMSGFWFMPSFVWDKHIVVDEDMLRSQLFFLKKLSAAIGDHRALLGIDIGNEINVYEMMLKTFSVEQGDKWIAALLNAANELFPDKCNVVGVDHQPWFADTQMSRKTLANTGALTSLHTWVKFTGALQFGDDSEEALCLQEYNVELANAYAEDLNRKVWIQEFGISPEWTKPENFKNFILQSMLNATRSENLWGYTFWCSHDVSRQYKFNSLEYELGLFDNDNRLKPVGEAYKECIAEIKSGARPAPLETGFAAVMNEKEPFDGWKYGKIFADNVRAGRHLQFVLSSKAEDETYLKNRGIKKLI
ncbi:MAG: hypothetical protein DBX59_03150 [Bacillota bacterium]|nr:MAG: hypothetical protein DBX59_03150 [Bacillota bacterium]